MIHVPILDLKAQYQQLKREIMDSIEMVMENGHFILGNNVSQLERDIADYCQVAHGVGVANGSDALHLSLLGCEIQSGDEVITTAFTFFATAGAIARVGAKPIFVDIDRRTYNIDSEKIARAVNERTKAIIPVHLYGQSADMDTIQAIAKKYDLFIIEDAAQAVGAEYKGKRVGSLGNVCCFSFFPTKNLGAYGDGGMVVTNDQELAERIRLLRVHGSKPKYYHKMLGYNSRLDELQAAILNVKWKHIDRWNAIRNEKADYYTTNLQSKAKEIVTPYAEPKNRHVFHQYTIRVPYRDRLQAYLKEQGVGTMVYYPYPLHLQPVFFNLGYHEGDLPETESACREVISLPIYPELTMEQQEYVIDHIVRFYEDVL